MLLNAQEKAQKYVEPQVCTPELKNWFHMLYVSFSKLYIEIVIVLCVYQCVSGNQVLTKASTFLSVDLPWKIKSFDFFSLLVIIFESHVHRY
jgi:hypothetical protein